MKMGNLALPALAGVMMMADAGVVLAQTPGTVVVNGTIAAVTATELDVTAADGTKSVITLDAKTQYDWAMPGTIADIKPGSYVGAGAVSDGNGASTAMEITVFPESERGFAEGFRPWDQGANSTMTNGTVSQVVGTSNSVLTVTYNGGQQTVTIPDGTPITTFSPADASALTVGANVVVRAFKGDAGALTADFVTIGKDGYVQKT